MTKVEIAVSVSTAIWMIIAIVLAVGLHKLIKIEYRKFYPHPSVGVILDNKNDYRLSDREKCFCNIASVIIFIPITFEWFIAWVLWQVVKLFIKPNNNKKLSEEKANYIEPETKAIYVPKTLRDLYEKLPIQIEEDQFLKMYNMVEAELSLEYCPLTYVENLKLDETNKVKYSNFTYNVVRVISVLNKDNAEVKFRCFPKSLKVFESNINQLSIKYNYTPKTKVTLDDESSYPLAKYFNVLMSGILAEYHLQLGDFEKAADYNAIYKREISALSPSIEN